MTTDNAYEAYFEALVKGGIGPLVEAAYRLTGHPVCVADEVGRFVAQCPSDSFLGAQSAECDMASEVSAEQYFLGLRQLKLASIQSNVVTMVKDVLDCNGYQLMQRFESNEGVVGYASVAFGGSEPTEREWRSVALFMRALAPELARHKSSRATYEENLARLLDDGPIDGAKKTAAALSFEKKAQPPYAVLYMPASEESERNAATFARRFFAIRADSSCTVSYGEGIVALLWGSLADCAQLASLDHALKTQSLRAATSTPFDDLRRAADYAKQARATFLAAGAANAPLGILHYADCAPYQLFAMVADDVDVRVLIHPAVLFLKAYDETHGTELLDTLVAYMQSNMNKAKTARVLCVHQNTLLYRLGRIEALCDLELHDDRTMNELRTSLYLLAFIR